MHEGLCAECLPKKRPPVRLPATVEVTRCAHCGRMHLPGGWGDASLPDALAARLAKEAKVPKGMQPPHFEVSVEGSDGTFQARVAARVTLPEMTVTQEERVEGRTRTTTCPRCSRQRGAYYEAILQLRAEGRDVRPQELQEARALVRERVAADDGLFVSREEAVHGGWDIYLSSSQAGKALAHELQARFGGRVAASPRLHTRKGGKEVYRTTYLVRLPGTSEGDVVRLEGRPCLVLAAGRQPKLWDLRSGEARVVDAQVLADAEPMEARVVPGQIVSREEGLWQVMDAQEFRVYEAAAPARLEVSGDEIRLVLAGETAYVAPP